MQAMSDLLVEFGADNQIATVTLNRPARRNALSRSLARALRATFEELAGRPALRVLVLTGAGERAFCAGADLTERRELAPPDKASHTAEINAAADALAQLPVPTIAAVRGYALGGGSELAIACDLRVAAEDAVFGFPEVKVGIFPGAGGVLRLPALVGLGAARDLLFTGRWVEAGEAFRLGLVDRVVPADDVLSTAQALATEIAANAPLAVWAVKRALRVSAEQPPTVARQAVITLRQSLDPTRDFAEGLAAFAEHRAPVFRGE